MEKEEAVNEQQPEELRGWDELCEAHPCVLEELWEKGQKAARPLKECSEHCRWNEGAWPQPARPETQNKPGTSTDSGTGDAPGEHFSEKKQTLPLIL